MATHTWKARTIHMNNTILVTKNDQSDLIFRDRRSEKSLKKDGEHYRSCRKNQKCPQSFYFFREDLR